MTKANYTVTFAVDQTPDEAFAAINNVRAWWDGEIEGGTQKLGDEFDYRYKDVHFSRQRLVELDPGRRVVWKVLDSKLNFIADKTEWTGTTISFDIASAGGRTEVRFTHVGLEPDVECYDACSNAWGGLITGNLRNLIATGRPMGAYRIVAQPR